MILCGQFSILLELDELRKKAWYSEKAELKENERMICLLVSLKLLTMHWVMMRPGKRIFKNI